jgi:hypothetical protein
MCFSKRYTYQMMQNFVLLKYKILLINCQRQALQQNKQTDKAMISYHCEDY